MTDTEQPKAAPRSFWKDVLWFVGTLAVVLGVAFLLKTFVFQTYNIPSGSMEDTIMTGDMVFAEKVTYYFRDVEAGDIITFESVDESEEKVLIKRVIAVGGQTVDIEDGHVIVDGEVLDEPYTQGTTEKLESSVVTYPYTVPEGYVWVMGDNREHSSDSRVFGAVPLENVLDRAVFVYWPLSDFGSLYAEDE